MSEKEYKQKTEQMFTKNTILINQLEQAKEIIKLAIKGIKKIACEERCDFVNKEFFCDDCVYGKWIAKAEDFLKE